MSFFVTIDDEMGRTVRLEFDTEANAEAAFNLVASHSNSGAVTLERGENVYRNFTPQPVRSGAPH